MRRLEALHLEHPFARSRMLRDLLRRAGIEVFRRHVCTLVQRIDIEALHRKPSTSRKRPAHPVFPHLLHELQIVRDDQVWAPDITYIPMARGWVNLVAVLDWHSRCVQSHRVSVPMEADFCMAALEEGITRYGAPEIVDTDQGSHFTGADFVAAVKDCGARHSMDGRGC